MADDDSSSGADEPLRLSRPLEEEMRDPFGRIDWPPTDGGRPTLAAGPAPQVPPLPVSSPLNDDRRGVPDPVPISPGGPLPASAPIRSTGVPPPAGLASNAAGTPPPAWAASLQPEVDPPPITPSTAPAPLPTGHSPSGPPAPGAVPTTVQGPEPRRRRPILPVLGIVAAVALVAVGGVVLMGRSPFEEAVEDVDHPDRWDPRVADLAEWVEDERGLLFDHPVEVEFLDDEAYAEAATAGDADLDDGEAAAGDTADVVALLRAVGLVSGDVDLVAAGDSLAADGTLAHYSFVDGVVRVRGTQLTPTVEVTLVHELTHVLQDQHFDLGRIADPDRGDTDVLRAIAEGDAERIEQIYLEEELSQRELEQGLEEAETDRADADRALADVPETLRTFSVAPYRLGAGFLRYVEAAEGVDAIDDVLAAPPTEEELLDPRLWAEGTEAREVDIDVPPGVEQLTDVEAFGPLTLFLMLASRGDPVRALATVDGWAADAYVAYRDGGTVCASIVVLGDSEDAATAIEWSFEAWASGSPSGGATISRTGDRVDLRTCDPGAEGGGTAPMHLLDAIDVRVGLEGGMVDAGASPGQAGCASRRILDDLGLAGLTDDAVVEDPVVGQRMRGHVEACG